jgi:hypothetical protein
MQRLLDKLDQVEAEMKSIGYCSPGPASNQDSRGVSSAELRRS